MVAHLEGAGFSQAHLGGADFCAPIWREPTLRAPTWGWPTSGAPIEALVFALADLEAVEARGLGGRWRSFGPRVSTWAWSARILARRSSSCSIH